MESRTILLTSAAHKYGNLNIRPCGRDFFPKDSFGGHNKNAGTGRPITIIAPGLKNPVKTDIPSDGVTGKPRWIFRERSWVKSLVKANNLIPGDKVEIKHKKNRTYELIPHKRQLTFTNIAIIKLLPQFSLPLKHKLLILMWLQHLKGTNFFSLSTVM